MVARIFNWAFIIFLMLVGIYLTLLGGFLTYLGGSLYYVVAGIGMLVVGTLYIRKNEWAVRIYALMLGLTIVWSLFEAGLDFMALLPRLAAWIVVGGCFLLPWRREFVRGLAVAKFPKLPASQILLKCGMGVGGVALLLSAVQGYERNSTGSEFDSQSPETVQDWRQYGNDDGGTRFAQIDQINTENVSKLKEVWRFRTGVSDDFKMTPLQVNGLLYLCGANNVLIAVDDTTGKEVWRYDTKSEPTAQHQYAKTCRGISYFEAPESYQGECKKRIVTGTVDARMMTVDAMTGELCTEFGEEGAIDLRKGMSPHAPDDYYVTSPPLVAGDVFVVGGLVLDSQDLGLPSGVVRAYDAITGEFRWAWDVGNPDYKGEPKEGETYTPGTPNVWSIMSYDAELDLIYAPTGNASPDYYGGERRQFDDEYSSAVVAIDAETGNTVWKFQTVYHDVWDYDVPAQPVLLDVRKDGEQVPSVAVPTKRGEIFLLDRRDGSPVHPIEDRPVPQDPVIGDYLAETQPFSSLPHFRPFLHEKDMWGLTPLDQLLCRVEYKMMRYEGHFTPPTEKGSLLFPANFGGFNWGSVSVDADNGLLVAAPMLLANRILQVTPEQVADAGPRAALLLGKNHPAVRLDPEGPMPEMGEADASDPYDHRRIKFYAVTMPFMSRFALPLLGGTQVPCFEPPWSQIAVIDLNTNELMWKRPLGSMKESGPFGWRSGLPFSVGTPVRAGTMTTRGGLTFMSSTMDRTVRAFDVRTGKVEWSQELPGNGQATPMSYVSEKSGKQYIIVTVPNPGWRYPRDPVSGNYTDSQSVIDGKGGYVIAYALDE
ncbi:outer membrane protein assembly factor BamB family protein [Hirschia maritima]|uniref:outer membrane protein assembly factor BamB family protein n=1 Tax=Hirschia maritima TaxID=1121961 RepID=UPI000363EC6A|nr:PQQ-binding-like beta-propeller repeat protein [Hirschia maritima]